MGSGMAWSNRATVAVAAVVVASMVAAGCGSGESDEVVVVETDPAPVEIDGWTAS